MRKYKHTSGLQALIRHSKAKEYKTARILSQFFTVKFLAADRYDVQEHDLSIFLSERAITLQGGFPGML